MGCVRCLVISQLNRKAELICVIRFKAVKCEALQEFEDGINKLPLEEEGGVTNTSFLALRKDGEGGTEVMVSGVSLSCVQACVCSSEVTAVPVRRCAGLRSQG